MSTDTATATAAVAHDDDHGAHPTDKLFVQIAVILAAITAAEVIWSYLPWGEGFASQAAEIGGLMIMMAAKFIIVANYFMHLKFDKKILSGLFYGGLILAIAVYVAALATFEFFTGSNPPYVG
jgi:cytochrome c oxidase subunit 4